ncbi:cysteine proteinase [Mycena vitilis]|nr:cysteine proteinase [Mycena vitilis]
MLSDLIDLFDADMAVDAPAGAWSLPDDGIGLLSTPELDGVIQECKSHVAQIAKQCRGRNSRYRDPDFDLEMNRGKCLDGLNVTGLFYPPDVKRVTELFEDPHFLVGGPRSDEIMQGPQTYNCWFISALSSTATVKGLVEKYCVARDEEVGVYGFIFWRDVRWVSVLIDDLLYTSLPRYEELCKTEKALFQDDKARYNCPAQKGSGVLYFAKSGSAGETWVPLVEKAYAKLHGDYSSLCGGYFAEGVEDLTGGVSSYIECRDILSKNDFWNDELLHANRDRVFSGSFSALSSTRNGEPDAAINGLRAHHTYSVLRTTEYTGKSGMRKRFLVLRDPCGLAEWNGPWSDGSKEWTPEWMDALPILGHAFGDAGKFVMEYEDFLSCFEQLDRTRLFGSSWTMRHKVVRVPSRPLLCSGFGHGDLCFSFSVSKTAPAVLVLAQLDFRYHTGIFPRDYCNFRFVLFKRGQKEPMDTSSPSSSMFRSVSLEFPELVAGEYIVHCHLDEVPISDTVKGEKNQRRQRKLAGLVTERAISESVAANAEAGFHQEHLAIPLDILAGQDLADLRRKADELKARTKGNFACQSDDGCMSTAAEDPTATTTTVTTTTIVRSPSKTTTHTEETISVGPPRPDSPVRHDADTPPSSAETSGPQSADGGSLCLGLKVYIPRDVSVRIQGQLRHDMRASFEGLTVADWNSFRLMPRSSLFLV